MTSYYIGRDSIRHLEPVDGRTDPNLSLKSITSNTCSFDIAINGQHQVFQETSFYNLQLVYVRIAEFNFHEELP